MAELADSPDDKYRTNVQIGEINALNACLAIIRFKQLRGFYSEEIPYYHLLFDISDLKIVGVSSDEDRLQRVHYMPKDLEPGVLYESEEFGTAAHLCACGSKIRTPLGPTEWSFEETTEGPTLSTSIGNWQQVCKSHYLIHRGKVIWADRWTPEQIKAGRNAEDLRRKAYYDALDSQSSSILRKLWNWLRA